MRDGCPTVEIMLEIFTANSLEDAKQQAAEAFGVDCANISFTVLEEPKKGLFSLIKKNGEYKVQAEYNPADSADSDAPSVAPAKAIAASNDDATQNAAQDASASVAKELAQAEQVIDPVVSLEKMQAALAYLNQILSKLAPDVTAEAQLTESGVEITLAGADAGALIGRRGDTLDAMQYLVSMVGNRGDCDYLRMTIDACGYREKRKKALQDLAVRISKSVLRNGRSVALEPMNPYERRIIHSMVTSIDGVSSHSSGEEPNRKVIIASDHPTTARPERVDRRREGGRDSARDGGRDGRQRSSRTGGRGRQDGPRPTGEGPRKLDLSTSFEKDYKRPKPEDSLHTGVYGKIDLD